MKSALSLLMGLAIGLSFSFRLDPAQPTRSGLRKRCRSLDHRFIRCECSGSQSALHDGRTRSRGHPVARLRGDLAHVDADHPRAGARFTVIAPDLPGIGDSAIPNEGLDMKTAAIRIHELARSLGVSKARVVGHDIGLMVAYSYAAQFPSETEKLVVMDAFLPGVAGWEGVYNSPNLWHFRFHGSTPETLVQGRERTYSTITGTSLPPTGSRSIPEADRQAYAAAYARPGRMRAGWGYFDSFPQAANDFAQLSQTRLTMPVLSIGGDKSLGTVLGDQMKLVATDVTVIVLKNTGHWLMEESPRETTDALVKFL